MSRTADHTLHGSSRFSLYIGCFTVLL